MATSSSVLGGKLSAESPSVAGISRCLLSSLERRENSSVRPWFINRFKSASAKKVSARRVGKIYGNYVCSGESTISGAVKTQNDSEMMVLARQAFIAEVSHRKCDDAVSLAKGALLISAEDQAFRFLNKEKDILAIQNETSTSSTPSTSTRVIPNVDGDSISLGVLSVAAWMEKFDALVKEVEAQLIEHGDRRRPLQILKAVNSVLFKIRELKRTHSSSDPLRSYMDHVLTVGSGTGILLGVIYMEVCRRLGVKMEGAAVRGSFLVWPLLEDSAQMVFEPCKSGRSWMFEDSEQLPLITSSPRDFSATSDDSILDLSVVRTLKPSSNRDILGMILKSLKKAYWKRAAKARPGLTPATPLQTATMDPSGLLSLTDLPVGSLLRHEDLCLAVMASERLLLLEPHNWALRKEHGLLLYHSRRYGEAVQELSICMALAPMREEELLQPFLERLHLMRLESSWGAISALV